MAKKFLPNLVVAGGRNGNEVTSIRSKGDSFIRGSGKHVFETDRDGKVIRDISLERVKVRIANTNPAGQIFEKMEKIGAPTEADLEILRAMGVTS